MKYLILILLLAACGQEGKRQESSPQENCHSPITELIVWPDDKIERKSVSYICETEGKPKCIMLVSEDLVTKKCGDLKWYFFPEGEPEDGTMPSMPFGKARSR